MLAARGWAEPRHLPAATDDYNRLTPLDPIEYLGQLRPEPTHLKFSSHGDTVRTRTMSWRFGANPSNAGPCSEPCTSAMRA